MKKVMLNGVLTTMCIALASVGISMTLKANVGVGSVNAFSTTVSGLTTVQVGSILIAINMSCVFIQLLLQRQDFHWRQWLQLGVSYLLGEMVNIMVYHVFAAVTLHTYWIRLLWFVIGTSICAIMVGVIIRLNLVVFPIEAMCNVVADKFNLTFKTVRQAVDIITILLALVLVFGWQGELTIREGTLLNVILFPTIIHHTLIFLEKTRLFHTVQYRATEKVSSQ